MKYLQHFHENIHEMLEIEPALKKKLEWSNTYINKSIPSNKTDVFLCIHKHNIVTLK